MQLCLTGGLSEIHNPKYWNIPMHGCTSNTGNTKSISIVFLFSKIFTGSHSRNWFFISFGGRRALPERFWSSMVHAGRELEFHQILERSWGWGNQESSGWTDNPGGGAGEQKINQIPSINNLLEATRPQDYKFTSHQIQQLLTSRLQDYRPWDYTHYSQQAGLQQPGGPPADMR